MNWKNKLKNGKKEKWIVMFLVGLLLLVIAIPSEKPKQEMKETFQSSEGTYLTNMENQLKRVLETVEGIGEVSVMITVSESAEKIIEKDKEISAQTISEEGQKSSSSTDTRETSVYAGGSGNENPYVIKEISPQIEGVVVVAEGGNNPVVVENISEAVQALFGIEPHKIKVMKHN